MKCNSCGNSSEFNRGDHGISCVYCGSLIPSYSMFTEGYTKDAVIRSEQDSDSEEGQITYSEYQTLVLESVFPVLTNWSTQTDSVKVAPHINHTKLNNFLTNYDLQWFIDIAEYHSQETVAGVLPTSLGVFAQVDCTFFGGAKESVVFCWGGIAYKELGESPCLVNWDVFLDGSTESVGIINTVLSIGEYKISFAGSDINNDMLMELIEVLNTLPIE